MKKILSILFLLMTFIGCSNSGLNETAVSSENINFIGKEYVLQGEYLDYNISLNFSEENFFGYGGVNNYFGKYKINENNINLGNIGRTMMMGPKEVMSAEDTYLRRLNSVKTFKISGDSLILKLEDGSELEFKAIPKPELKK